ncbi:MAG TPA: ATP-binding protein [Acidobacteriaceae bacterium]|nr:ATP-binding protein [Acidobacteriaceae bacterium]
MRIRVKLVLAITGMVSGLVVLLSTLYLAQLLSERIQQSYRHNDIAAHQVLLAVQTAVERGMSHVTLAPHDPNALDNALARVLQKDSALQLTLVSFIRYSPTIYDINVADSQNKILISTDPHFQGKPLPQEPFFTSLQKQTAWRKFRIIFGRPTVYAVDARLDRKIAGKPVRFLTVRVGVRTTFLRSELAPWLRAELVIVMLSMLVTILLAALLSNMALHPLELISNRLDQFMAAEPQSPPSLTSLRLDEVSNVSNKIERIGQRIRSVEEVFTALQENLNQVLENLQDGVMLFTRDGRVVMVSDSVEHFLGLTRTQMLGMEIHDIFVAQTSLGQVVRRAYHARATLMQEEITTETGRRLQVSLDFIQDDDPKTPYGTLGTLLTLHDSESMRQIENELELSRRLADLGRLTSGVGHEVKNPINAIVVHLELLREKLARRDSSADRHVDVIQNEIRRLDRVVQTLIDFSRPVELDLAVHDLRSLVTSVLTLAAPDLEQRAVRVVSTMPDHPVCARVDADLIQQALLNVLLNGAQAMADGGELTVELRQQGHELRIKISDHGCGIPREILDRIFNLYFTTKRDGSGIGLAMTYRILHLHNGSIQVESEMDRGTQFTLRLPVASSVETKISLQSSVS